MQTQQGASPTTLLPSSTIHRPSADRVRAAIAKRSFATLATTSAGGRPHVAGVLYELVGDVLYVNTLQTSRKARNIASNPRVGVCIPVRRLPIGPPSTVQFQTEAELLSLDDERIGALLSAGHLKSITGHGELETDAGCFLALALTSRLVTYGLGMSLRQLIKHPLAAGGVVELDTRS